VAACVLLWGRQTGKPGVVVSSDPAKWQVQVLLEGDPKPKWLHPGKLEMDLAHD
jgi:hypothetical protein